MDAFDAPTCAVGGDSRIRAVNRAWATFMTDSEGRPDDCGEGADYLSVCDRVAPGTSDHADATDVAEGLRGVLAGRVDRLERQYPCHRPDRQQWFSVRIVAAELAGGAGAVLSHVDVTQLHQVRSALSHQALHDDLTGLPNRLLLVDRLTQALGDGARRALQVGIGFLDLDHFKRVNDSLGRGAGDTLLVQVAERLGERLRAGDTLCRYAADEFVIGWCDLVPGAAVTALSERLADVFAESFDLGAPRSMSPPASGWSSVTRPTTPRTCS